MVVAPQLNHVMGILARKACEKTHKSIDSLKRSLRAAWDEIGTGLVAEMLAKGLRPWWRPGMVILKTNTFF